MIVVDSSVWIDWFRDARTDQTMKLRAARPSHIIVGDIILLEVLRGSRTEEGALRIENELKKFGMVTMLGQDAAVRAAALYRRLRRRGVTVRKSPDLLIANFCIDHGHRLLHNDRDFWLIAEHVNLAMA